ncbi:hypothetical protein ON010_g5107 [Phytophthora cinnamomi]|nr:hypothetical protein ON010_g5107 [Phytophthora cinnamomi]
MGQEHDHGAVGFVRESVEWNGPGNRVRWGGKSMVKAIENGNPEVARWLYKNTLYDPTDSEIDLVVCGALKLGDIELAQLFVSPTRSIFDYASGCPHPDVVEMMLENGYLGWSQDAAGAAMRALAIHGRLDLMKRVAQVYTAPPSNEDAWLNGWRLAMIEAIKRGDLLMLQWLGKHPSGRELLSKHKVSNEYLDLNAAAATKGYVDVMHYLHNEGFADEYEGALIAAVRSGRLDSVKWLLPRVRRLTNANLMDEAAVYGHLEILQYFHDTDLPELPRLSCSSEKELVYLNANSDSSLKSLLRDITALEMIRSTGCSVQAMNFSAARGHLEVVKWLHNHCVEGCTTLAMDNAAASGHLDVVKWLHFNRSEGCTTHAMDVAAQEGHLDTVKWLYANRSEGCTFRAIEMATTNGHLRVACWLRVHYPQHFVAMVGKSISTESALDILLFLHVHCAHVFTIWFCARLRRPLLSSSVESYDLVAQWLEKHYPDHETEIQ